MKMIKIQGLHTVRMMVFLSWAGLLFAPLLNAQPLKKNMINKVLHHKASRDSLELGQLVFCFTQEPKVEKIPKKIIGQSIEMAFLFPGTKINSSAQSMVHKINAGSKEAQSYRVAVKETAQGILLVIAYDPRKVRIEYDTFTNIDCLKGLIFRLYNAEMLDSLQKTSGSLLRTASARGGKHRIVIDCGHGGTDTGTISATHIAEKNVALDVGLQVASLLRKDGFDVFLTRDRDINVDLDERTTLANFNGADMFVSIHANSAPKEETSGIETFCLKNDLFSTSFSDHDPEFFKAARTLMQDRNNDSLKLASYLQDNTLATVKKKHASVVNRKVRHAVAQVLCGSHMPSALIEVCFLSNTHEAALLSDKNFRHLVAQGIRNGVVEYAAHRLA